MSKRLKKNYLSFWFPVKKNKVGVSDLKPSKNRNTFQESLRLTLIIGQVFSLLPVEGVHSKKASHVKFTWSSWKCYYLFVSLLGQSFITIMCIYKVANSTATLNGTTPLIFYGTACITMVMFFRIAMVWPDLVQHIARIEESDPNSDHNLLFKCNATCVIVLSLALKNAADPSDYFSVLVTILLIGLVTKDYKGSQNPKSQNSPIRRVEHLLSLLSAIAGASVCHGNESSYRGFVGHFYPWVFNYIPYSLWLGIITQLLTLYFTLTSFLRVYNRYMYK